MAKPTAWYQAGLGGSGPEIYEQSLVSAIFAPFAEGLVALAAPPSGARVLDVACGTGVVTRAAAQRVGTAGQVVGLDLSAAMLAVARVVPSEPGAVIEWQEGNALALPFPDQTFDLVTCQQGVQFFPDRAAGLREMHRVLVSGGRVALSIWGPLQRSPGFTIFADALARHVAPGLLDGPFSLSDSNEVRTLLVGAGFHEVTIQPVTNLVRFRSTETFLADYIAGSPLAGTLAKVDDRVRAAIGREVSEALLAHKVSDGIAFPIESQFALARRSE
jgi:SAM-dependent methyltransferase